MSSRRLYRSTGIPVITALIGILGGLAVVILSHPDPVARTGAVILMGFGLTYGYLAALGNHVQVKDGALIVVNLYRAHRIPLRRFVDLTTMDHLAVYANTVEQEAVEIHAMTQLQSTSPGSVRRKLKRLLVMLEEHAAPPADGPVTVRLRWESVTVMGVGLLAWLGGILVYVLVYA
ncbi:hypothetical protein [Asanoa siamensis]|nr:hypothetical protein [Asanoa siamensis]